MMDRLDATLEGLRGKHGSRGRAVQRIARTGGDFQE